MSEIVDMCRIIKNDALWFALNPDNVWGSFYGNYLNFNGYSSDSIGTVSSDNDIAVRTGLHCAPYAHKFLGTFPAGTVRFSISYFNADSDFEKLNWVLKYIEENI